MLIVCFAKSRLRKLVRTNLNLNCQCHFEWQLSQWSKKIYKVNIKLVNRDVAVLNNNVGFLPGLLKFSFIFPYSLKQVINSDELISNLNVLVPLGFHFVIRNWNILTSPLWVFFFLLNQTKMDSLIREMAIILPHIYLSDTDRNRWYKYKKLIDCLWIYSWHASKFSFPTIKTLTAFCCFSLDCPMKDLVWI